MFKRLLMSKKVYFSIVIDAKFLVISGILMLYFAVIAIQMDLVLQLETMAFDIKNIESFQNNLIKYCTDSLKNSLASSSRTETLDDIVHDILKNTEPKVLVFSNFVVVSSFFLFKMYLPLVDSFKLVQLFGPFLFL